MSSEVTLRVECLTPERLIERATSAGARLENVRLMDGHAMELKCDSRSAALVLSLCERYHLPARVTGRRGRAALARFARSRPTLPVGLLLAAALCALFLGRIWMIDIAFSGESASLGDPAALSRALTALDIGPGIDRRLNPEALARRLQADGSYSYVGVRVQGVRLLVEAVPEVPSPALYDVDAARDLVCGINGIVVRAVARSGELCVNPGDVVCPGQLLIRGEELSGREETRPIAALGEVIVRAWFEGEARLPTAELRTVDTGRVSTSLRLIAPGIDWPIAAAEDYASQRVEREFLPIGSLFLPVGIERVTHVETRVRREAIDRAVLEARLSALALADAAARLAREGPESFVPADSWVDYEYSDGSLCARAVIEIQTNAAITREALQGG